MRSFSRRKRFVSSRAKIADDQQLPANWLNDGVKGFLSARHDVTTGTLPQFPNLRLTMPVPEYMLAMKLMALRLDTSGGKSDLEDIINLMQISGMKEKGDILRFASRFYPEARTSGKLVLAIDHLWNEYSRRRERPTDETPSYLGRGGRED